MRKLVGRATLVLTLLTAASVLPSSADPKEAPMAAQLRLALANGSTVVVVLDNNKTALDLLSRLPLTLEFGDYNRTEKVTRPLSPALGTAGAPAGYDPEPGDLCLYAPWGNLCLFYRDFGYAAGLIRLGTVVAGLEHLKELEGPVLLERAVQTQGGKSP